MTKSGGQAPRRAAAVGAHDAQALRSQEGEVAPAPHPHPDLRIFPPGSKGLNRQDLRLRVPGCVDYDSVFGLQGSGVRVQG